MRSLCALVPPMKKNLSEVRLKNSWQFPKSVWQMNCPCRSTVTWPQADFTLWRLQWALQNRREFTSELKSNGKLSIYSYLIFKTFFNNPFSIPVACVSSKPVWISGEQQNMEDEPQFLAVWKWNLEVPVPCCHGNWSAGALLFFPCPTCFASILKNETRQMLPYGIRPLSWSPPLRFIYSTAILASQLFQVILSGCSATLNGYIHTYAWEGDSPKNENEDVSGDSHCFLCAS